MKRINRLKRESLGAGIASADESCQTDCAPRTKRLLKLGIIGTVITALCCFTPVLLVTFGALGLAGYLDYVLFPMLGVFLLLLIAGAVRFFTQSILAKTTEDGDGIEH